MRVAWLLRTWPGHALAASALCVGACGGDVADGDVADDPPPAEAARTPRSRAAAAPTASPATTQRSPLLADGDLGGYVPDDSLVARAAALGDPATRDDAWPSLFALSDAERIALLRAGLRLRDPVAARTAAAQLDWRQLDAWETARFVSVRLDAALDPEFTLPDGQRLDLDEAREAFGSPDVAMLLDRLAAWPAGTPPPDAEEFAGLEVCVGLDALDAIARVLARADAPGRDLALRMLAQLAVRTDRRREDIAAALLGVPTAAARSRIPEDRDLVRAALATEGVQASDARSLLRRWADRWLDELGPTAEEVEAERLREHGLDCIYPDSIALEWLRERPEALKSALLAEQSPPEGGGTVEASAPEDLEELSLVLLVDLESALRSVTPWDGSVESAFRGFDARAAQHNSLSAAHLVALATSVPGCRTRLLAEAVLAQLPQENWLRELYDDRNPDFDAALPFLESCAPESLLRHLRRCSLSADGPTRDQAMYMLLKLRDSPSIPAILRWAESLRQADFMSVPWREIGDLPHPDARAFLVRHVAEHEGDFVPSVRLALEAIAWFDGARFEGSWAKSVSSDAMPEIACAVLAGRAADAVFAAVDAVGPDLFDGLAGVRDPRTIPTLRRKRERRELGLWPEITAELALAGDETARAEVLDAIRAGRPGWLKAMTERQQSLGDPVAMIPVWLAALETSPGAEGPALRWFERTFGMPEIDPDEGDATPVARVRAFLDRHGNRFVESRLAGHWVPAPR